MSYTVNAEGWELEGSLYRVTTCLYGISCITEFSILEHALTSSALSLDEAVIEQRYTDQQIELLQRGEGWIVWDAGIDSKSPIENGLMFDMVLRGGGGGSEKSAHSFCWAECQNLTIVAYRLTTNDHYINGKPVVLQEGDWVEEKMSTDKYLSCWEVFKCLSDKAEGTWNIPEGVGKAYFREGMTSRKLTLSQVLNAENAKPSEEEIREKLFQAGGELGEDLRGRDTTVSEQCEDLHENNSPNGIEWKKGTLPPIGIDCEVYTSGVWKAGFTAGKNKEGNIVVQVGENYIAKGSANSFRPPQTERDKVIEKAIEVQGILSPSFDCKDDLGRLYDADMLKLPEGE